MKELMKKRRCMSHRKYVTHRMAELQTEIFNDAMATGKVNLEKRQQLLKQVKLSPYFCIKNKKIILFSSRAKYPVLYDVPPIDV